MAKLGALPSQSIIDGFKGTIDFYVHDGIPCARRWPRPPSGQRSPAVQAQWPIFTEATRLWNELSPEEKQAWEETASGTILTARDCFMSAYLSGNVTPAP